MSNMYPWTSGNDGFTWNPIGGNCSHECKYCYRTAMMKRSPVIEKKYTGEPRIVEKEMHKNLGKNRTVFVCSMCDLFAKDIPDEIILDVLGKCKYHPYNTYLFQSKNPYRIYDIIYKAFEVFPPNVIFGTTIESNIDHGVSEAPTPEQRYESMLDIRKFCDKCPPSLLKPKIMISIEPILEFDLKVLTSWIKDIKPDFVSIGSDSKGHGLEEPDAEKVEKLITALSMGSEVKLKSNLSRLTG